jgi:hypothetical protein
MGGALVTTAIGYRIVFGSSKQPLFEKKFSLPTNRNIDLPLIGGSALFGIGWGIAGFCPGGAIPALGLGDSRTLIFFAAMAAGLVGVRIVRSMASHTIQA